MDTLYSFLTILLNIKFLLSISNLLEGVKIWL